MVRLDYQLVDGLKNMLKPKAQEGQKLLNLAVPRRTEVALLEIFIFQFFKFNFTVSISFFNSCLSFDKLLMQLDT